MPGGCDILIEMMFFIRGGRAMKRALLGLLVCGSLYGIRPNENNLIFTPGGPIEKTEKRPKKVFRRSSSRKMIVRKRSSRRHTAQ